MSKKKYKKVRRRRIVAILLTIFTLGTSFMDALQVSAASNVGIYIGNQANDVTEDTDTSLESPDEQDSETREEESSENPEEQNVEDKNEKEEKVEEDVVVEQEVADFEMQKSSESNGTKDIETKVDTSQRATTRVEIEGGVYLISVENQVMSLRIEVAVSGSYTTENLVEALNRVVPSHSSRHLIVSGMKEISGGGSDTVSGSYFERFRISSFTSADLTTVGANAFNGRDLVSVSLPKVTSVGDNAFNGNTRLVSVSLPEVTNIGIAAFRGCTSLTSFNFPKVTSVDGRAFERCTSLTSVDFPKVMSIGNFAFLDCTSLTSVNLPLVSILGNSAFQSCTSLTSVSFPEATSIGVAAFQSCTSLTSVNLPKATGVGSNAFSACRRLEKVTIGMTSNTTTKAISDYFISASSTLKELTVLNTTRISANGSTSHFAGYTALETVSFPEVTSVENHGFRNCTRLKNVSLPKATSLGNHAFTDCTSLTTINFPTVTSVGSNAFDGCNKLEKVTIGMASDITASEIATLFTDARSTLRDLTVLNMTSIEGGSSTSHFAGYTALETISFPKVTSLEANAFANCTSLINVSLPEVTNVGNSAFANCTSLISVSLPEATSIGANAFANCAGLTNVSFPEAMSIGTYAFIRCTSLTSVSFPEAKSIGIYAFWNCPSLTSVSLPKVTRLDGYVFNNSGVLMVEIPMIETLNTNAFSDSSVELITTRNGKQDIVKGHLASRGIVGIITDAPKLEDQSLTEGDLLELSNPSIINDSLTGVKATVSSSWKKDGKDVGVGLKYSVESVGISDAGKYQNVINVTFSNGTKSESFSTNEANVVVEGKVALTVKYLNMKGEEIADSETLTGKQGTEYTTEAKIIENHTLNETPSNATGTFTDAGQTVTYVYGEYEWDSKSGTLTVLDNVTGKAVFWAVEHEGIENVKHLVLKDSPNVTADFKIPQMDNLEALTLTNTTELGAEALKDSTSVKEIDMSKVTSVGNNVFSGCNNLEKVTIGMSSDTTASTISTLFTDARSTLKDLTVLNMTNITASGSTSHFAGYTALETVSFPEVTSVGSDAFRECTSLTSVSLPKATSVGHAAFDGCTGLTSINFPEVTSVDYWAFRDCSSLKSVNFPKLTSLGDGAFINCTSLTSVSLPEVTNMERRAFQGCTSLTSVSFPKVTSVAQDAFQNCTSLKSVSFPEATSVGNAAFDQCTSLTSVNLPEVTSIGWLAFSGCRDLTSVSLPKVTHLGDALFRDSGVLMVDVPMIETLHANAFSSSSVELITTRNGKQDVVKGQLATYRIVGIVTDAPKLEDQSLTEGDLLELSNPSIINDSLTGVKATVSSSWKHDGKEAGTALIYSVESVELSDAGKYQNVLNVTFSNGTDAGSFSTNEANVTVEMEVGLWFSEVPSTIEFEDTTYQNKLLTINRKDPSLSMSIKDTRPSGSTWKVHASVENPLTTMDGKHQLGDSIVYKDSNGQTLPLNNMQQEVFSGTKGEEIITNIAWGEGEGPLLQLNPLKEQVKIGEKYTATITWTLMDVWSPEPEDNFKEGATFEADGYEWQVLKNDGKHAMIITKDVVGISRFNPSGAGNVYEGSVLETAMKDFYTNNLNILKSYALPVNLPASSSSVSDRGNVTTVASSGTPTAFALSTADVVTSSEAWPTNADRIAQLNGSNRLWRLRSRGTNNNFAVTVGSTGTISNGFSIINIDEGLRPALYIDIQAFAANEG